MPGKARVGTPCTTLATNHFWGAFDARPGRHGWAFFERAAMFEFKGTALIYSSSHILLLCGSNYPSMPNHRHVSAGGDTRSAC